MSSAFSATPSVSKASNAKTSKGGKGKSKIQGDGKKVGNPGNFQGARLVFLESQLPIYLSKKNREEVIDFFKKTLELWGEKFPWWEGYGPDGNTLSKRQAVASLGDDGEEASAMEKRDVEERDVGDPGPIAAADDAHGERPTRWARPTRSASPATQGAATQGAEGPWSTTGGVDPAFKIKIVTEVNLQVKGWFSHRKTVAHRALKNPFLEWLERAEVPASAPRKLPLNKFYMQHTDYAEAVEARFNREWPKANMETKYVLDFRCKCARDLVAEEDEATRAKLTAELEAQHEAAMAQYTARMNGAATPEEPDAAKREACRANLAQVAQPFLDGVTKLTGLHLILLAGAAPPAGSDKYIMTA
ncbi:hypothetical protein B0H14DRAFT_3426085 [Mycena olivaceomarginata]|nr:hypothetical protein B0H14DRAFT_3426085 [Mycena olivaceomarginata]